MQDILTYIAILTAFGFLLKKVIKVFRPKHQTSPSCSCACSGCGLKNVCAK